MCQVQSLQGLCSDLHWVHIHKTPNDPSAHSSFKIIIILIYKYLYPIILETEQFLNNVNVAGFYTLQTVYVILSKNDQVRILNYFQETRALIRNMTVLRNEEKLLFFQHYFIPY